MNFKGSMVSNVSALWSYNQHSVCVVSLRLFMFNTIPNSGGIIGCMNVGGGEGGLESRAKHARKCQAGPSMVTLR